MFFIVLTQGSKNSEICNSLVQTQTHATGNFPVPICQVHMSICISVIRCHNIYRPQTGGVCRPPGRYSASCTSSYCCLLALHTGDSRNYCNVVANIHQPKRRPACLNRTTGKHHMYSLSLFFGFWRHTQETDDGLVA